jgi:hypothetical protein
MFHEPVAWVVVVAVAVVFLNRIMAHRKRSLADGLGVEYEDAPISAMQTLELNA